MSFIFPDDKATFTAPNGITYAWKTDHWVVQKFKGDHEVYVSPTPPDDPQEGKLWYDSTGDVIELFIYVDGAWVSATPNSEYALEARIAANEDGIRDLWSDQQRQDFEIAGIANRVDQLEGKVGEYTYTFQTANQQPRDGQLSMLKADMSTTTRWEEAESLVFNPTTLSGDTFDQSEIVTGDVIRLHVLGDITMQVSAFEARVIQNNNGILSIDQKVKTVGTGMDNTTYEVFHLSSFDPSGLATMNYVDAQDALLQSQIDDKADTDYVDDNYLKLTGGTLTGAVVGPAFKGLKGSGPVITVGPASDNIKALIHANGLGEFASGKFNGVINFQRGKDTPQFKISPNASETDWATNIYSLNGGNMRLRTSHTTNEGDHVGSHIILDSGGGVPETKIYHVVTPTNDSMAANKAYVDAQAGVPAGCIMIWMNSTPPPGWFKLQGGSFDTAANPNLHAYLLNTTAYTPGTLPDWSGRYPGNYGDHIPNPLGSKQNQKTAKPSGGAPKTNADLPNGNTRTFSVAGNTNAYSDGLGKVVIDHGWDDVTRPPTVVVHYIIKGG